MEEDLRVVFESRNRRSCSDRALVLAALQIPHQLIDDGVTAVLVVPAEHSARAVEELRLYDEENPPVRPKKKKRVVYQDALPGVVGYFLVVCIVAGLAGYSMLGRDWFAAGRVDGELIRNGEWWRTITALTLHADAKHLIGNLVFGVLFGLFAGRLLGSLSSSPRHSATAPTRCCWNRRTCRSARRPPCSPHSDSWRATCGAVS